MCLFLPCERGESGGSGCFVLSVVRQTAVGRGREFLPLLRNKTVRQTVADEKRTGAPSFLFTAFSIENPKHNPKTETIRAKMRLA